MTPNVHIKHWQRGRLKEERVGHNVWLARGHEYLAEIIAEGLPAIAPIPEREERIRYMGLGIGGRHRLEAATLPPLSTGYPAGSAALRWFPDYGTTLPSEGNQYDERIPLSPLIDTLELPVRKTGGEDPYPGDPGDEWLIGPPSLYVSHASTQELTVHALVDCTAGDYIYGSFTTMPITEAALFTDAEEQFGVPYGLAVAYIGFGTIILDATSRLEIVWRIRFG